MKEIALGLWENDRPDIKCDEGCGFPMKYQYMKEDGSDVCLCKNHGLQVLKQINRYGGESSMAFGTSAGASSGKGKTPVYNGQISIGDKDNRQKTAVISLWAADKKSDKSPVFTGTIEFMENGSVSKGDKMRVSLWNWTPKKK